MPAETPEQVMENLQIEEKTPLEKKEDIKEIPPVEEKAEKQEEEKNEEEKPHPPEGSKRWNEVYRKAKENERKVKQLEKDIELLRDHNQQLAEAKKIETEVFKKHQEKTVKDQIKDLRVKIKKAEAEGDWEKSVEYETQIEELKFQISQKNEPIVTNKNIEQNLQIKNKEETEKAVRKFTKENPWFNEDSEDYDDVMAGAAIILDQKLMESWDGTIEERFAEVRKKIEERFNYKKNGNNKPTLPNVVGGDNPPTNKTTKIELTQEQKRVANMLFPGDKDAEKKYSSQLQFIPKKG